MRARRIARTVLIGCLLACPFAARGGAAHGPEPAAYELPGPTPAEPTRRRLEAATPAKSADPASLLADSWRADAFALGLAPGLIPSARVLDPLPEVSQLARHDPVAASLEVTALHPALTGLSARELGPAVTRETPKINIVHFRQTIQGLPVLGSKVTFGWDRAGRLRLAGSTVYLSGPLEGSERVGAPAPPVWIARSEAERAALAGFPAETRASGWETAERAWLPSAGQAAAVSFLPVWSLRFHTTEPAGWWEARVDGATGELLERRSLILDAAAPAPATATVRGRVTGWIEPMTAGDPPAERPFQNQSVELRSNTNVVYGTTDLNGEFAIQAPSPGEYTLRAMLSGPYVRVVEESREGQVATQSTPVTAPGGADLVWEAPVSLETRDAFRHANVAHDVVRAWDDGPALDPLDRPLDVVVNAPISQLGRCNGWWDGTALWFHRASTWCISFARIASVVYHEYRHAVTTYVCGAFTPPDYLNEGWSDYFAATIQDDPRIGLGFMGPNTMFRDLAYDRVWPDDASWDPHFQGLIIASTLWDLRQLLGASRTDSLFHFAIYGAAQSHEEYLLDLLAWDDDDGEIDNGTPHFEEIVSTFRAHGIADDGVYLAFDPIADPLEGPDSIALEVNLRSPLHAVDVDSSALYARRAGEIAYTRYPLTRLGRTRTFAATVPMPLAGQSLEFYWRGVNAYGRTSTLPSAAPDASFSFQVRADRTAPELRHSPLGSLAAGTNGVWVQARAEDASACVESVVTTYRLMPGGVASELALASLGGGVYSARLPLGTLEAGQWIEYSIVATDCAGEPNRSVVPEAGVLTVPVRVGSCFDFEAEAGPLQAEGDWAWRVAPEPGFASSGTHGWGTDLDGGEGGARASDLIWGPVDLRAADRASLRLRQVLRIPAAHAGARVDVATSPVPNWRPLVPDGGYPEIGPGEMGRCFGGTTELNEEAVFPLDRYLGRKVWFRFHYQNDGTAPGSGWFLDDLRLLQDQARSRPLDVEAISGQNRQVTLRWRAPAGVDSAGGKLLGYRLYRPRPALNETDLPLVDLPPSAVTYVDPGLRNGIAYGYRLHALYPEGESAGIERDATPNAGHLALDASPVDLVLSDFAAVDTTVRLGNSGLGDLSCQLFVGPAAAALTDVRVAYPVRPGESAPSLTVHVDPNEEGAGPDLAAIDARQWSDSTGRFLELTLRGREAWGSPATDWGGALLLDTDLDLTTGVDGFGTAWRTKRGIGADWIVLFGRAAAALGWDGTKAWLVPAGQLSGEALVHAELAALADRLTLSIPLARLGDPEEMQLAVFVGGDAGEPASDRIPDQPPSWLQRDPLRARLAGGEHASVSLSVDGTGLPNGAYVASIVVESNDPDTPWRRLPVRLRVDRDFPAELGTLSFRSMRAGLEGNFHLRPEVRPDTVDVERWSEDAWSPLARAAQPEDDGGYRFFDRRAALEDTAAYRVRVVEGTRRHYYGPYRAHWDFTPPAISAPELVSTAEGIAGTLRLADALGLVEVVRAERRRAETEEWVPLIVSAPDTTRLVRFFDRWSVLRSAAIRPDESCFYRFQIDTAGEDSLSYGPYEVTFVPPRPAELTLHPPRPTPFRESTALRLDLPADAAVRLEVFDAQGRRRATLLQGRLAAGIHQVAWDGRDSNGFTVPAGTYWLRLSANGAERTVRTVRFR